MTFGIKYIKFVVMCLVAFGHATYSPRSAGADGGAIVLLDDEVNQCIADCMAKEPASSGDLDACRTKLKSCEDLNKSWFLAYNVMAEECGKPKATAKDKPPGSGQKKSARSTTPAIPPIPKPPRVQVVICEGGATKSANGKYCECTEGVPARLVSDKDVPGVKHAMCVYTVEDVRKIVAELNRKFDALCKPSDAELGRPADLQASCDQTGADLKELILWYRSLVGGKTPLNKETWTFVYEKVTDLDKRLGKLEDRVGNLEKTLCAPFPDDPAASMKDRCSCPSIPGKPEATKEERCAPPEKASSGPFKGGLEWELAGGGFYLHRPGFPTDTPAVLGVAGLTGWVDDTHGVRIRGYAGMGFNAQSQRLFTGAELAYRLNFSKKKEVGLALGIQGTVEPNDVGNDASNLGGKFGIHFRPGGGRFFIEPELVMGGTKVMDYASGARTGPSNWGFFVQPGIVIGGVL